jgi:hypothetical protein
MNPKTVTMTVTPTFVTTAEGDELTGIINSPRNLTKIYTRFSGDGMKSRWYVVNPFDHDSRGGNSRNQSGLGFHNREIAIPELCRFVKKMQDPPSQRTEIPTAADMCGSRFPVRSSTSGTFCLVGTSSRTGEGATRTSFS